MRTGAIRVEDLVKCDVKGRVFYAEVIENPCVHPMTKVRGLRVKPLLPNQTRTFVRSGEVTAHYAKRRSA